MNEVKIYLTLIGKEFDPEAVSRQAGMEADTVRLPNEILKNGCRFGHTEWGIETGLIRGDELEPLLRSLLGRISCTPQRLARIAKKYRAKWHILIWISTYGSDPPMIYFPEDIIQFMAQMHAQIGFDNYIYPEDSGSS